MQAGAVAIDGSEKSLLRAKVEELEAACLMASDAAFQVAGILSRIIVEAGLAHREDLADAIERSARPVDTADHNPALLAFGRAIRMNFPGGRFDVIDGGGADS